MVPILISKNGHQQRLIQWIVPIAGGLLALVVLLWLYQDIEFGLFLSTVADAKLVWIFILGGSVLLEQLIRGWKWRQILFDLKPIPTIRLFGAVLAGYGVVILIPLGVSPLVRSWLIARLDRLRWASVLMTTAVERFLDGVVFALVAALVATVGQFPDLGGDLRAGLAVAGGLNFVLFSLLLCIFFMSRRPLSRDDARISRFIDWLAAKGGARLKGVREAIRDGIVWPLHRQRQIAAVLGSVLMKMVAATHFLWAGTAVGVVLAPLDYLFLMVVAGFALVLARFIRLPGGFIIGSGFALRVLGVADEQALAMILFNHMLSSVLMVGPGLLFLWSSGIIIRQARETEANIDAAT